MDANADTPARGLTPNELAAILRVSADKIRAWIASGELGAINTAASRCGKPRFVVLPHHLVDFENRRRVAPLPKPMRRKRRADALGVTPDAFLYSTPRTDRK